MCGCTRSHSRLREALQSLLLAAELSKRVFIELAAMEQASRPGSPIAAVWEGHALVMARAIEEAARAGR